MQNTLALSTSRGLVPLIKANPSSLYNPMLLLSNLALSLFNAYKPTSSQISAQSKLPMVTSNVVGLFRFIHGLVELNKRWK
jgi:hypothetical protein